MIKSQIDSSKTSKDDTDFSWTDLLKTIWYFLEGQRIKYVFLTLSLFALSFYQLIPALFTGKIIDFFTAYKNGDSLDPFYILVLAYTFLTVVVGISRLVVKKRIGDLNAEIKYNGRVKGFSKLINNSLTWHEEENTGNKIQKINNGISSLMQLLRNLSSEGLPILGGIVGVIAFFIFSDIKLAIFLVGYFIIFWLIQIAFADRIKVINDQINKSSEKASGSYVEGLSNILTIKTLGAGESFKNKIDEDEKKNKELTSKSRILSNSKWRVFNIFTAVSLGIYLLMVGNNVVTGAITVGSLLVYYNYMNNLIGRASESTDLIDQLIELKSGVGRMMPIYFEESAKYFGNKNFPKNWKKLEIDNASFSYKSESGEKFSIKDLNILVNKGEKIGIVGRSGSGKSTLVKLLLGLYKIEKGSIKVDSTNFYSINHEEITKNLSVVLQESELFNQTLNENITLMRSVDIDLLKKSVQISQIEDLIKKLPNGVESLIGEKGYKVSGGERQRIGIARAVYKNSDILIFDEATSNLDSKTEQSIQDALINELKDQTMIIIAHRLSTLKNVDRIYVFENGAIIEEGKFDELLKNKDSKFFELYNIQSKNQAI